MRILFYSYHLNETISSAAVHITEVLSGLTRLGHNVMYADGQLFSTKKTIIDNQKQTNITHNALWRFFKTLTVRLRFYDEVKLVIDFFDEIGLFFSALVRVVRFKPDIIYRRHALFHSEYVFHLLFRIPCFNEVNGLYYDERKVGKNKDKLSLFLFNVIERVGLAVCSWHIVVTSKLKDVLHNDYGISEKRIVVIENGVNTDLFKPMDKEQARINLKLDAAKEYVCFVGYLATWQGIEHLVKAMTYIIKENANTQLLIVGDGTIRDELEVLTEQLGMSDTTIFTGRVPYDQVPLYINASDVCVVPKIPMRSGYSPLKLCEYLACGKPVVASNISGFEVLLKYECGYLATPENAEDLAQAIIKLLQDASLRKTMGENGKKYVVENRSWDVVVKKIALVFENIKNKKTINDVV